MVIHFVGCEGSSMKVLARIAASMGHRISGSDTVLGGHDARNVIDAQRVIFSSAIAADNVELAEAKRRGIPCVSRAEFLGEVSRMYSQTVAVSGAHGKTTTTAMLGCIFASRNPTVHLGGKTGGECGHVGGKDFFITEACEYKRSFLSLYPHCSVILNIDLDHTDCYTGIEDVSFAFNQFASQSRMVFLNGDDERARQIKHAKRVTFGLLDGNDYIAKNIKEGSRLSFEVFERGVSLGEFELAVSGRHNVVNALAAVAVARHYRVDAQTIKNGLTEFKGVDRRFERVGEYNGCLIYTDYAHHPAQITGVIECAKTALGRPVTVAFEPHTYTRLHSLLPEFVTSLSAADKVCVLPVYPAREKPIEGVSSHLLVRGLMKEKTDVKYYDCYCSLIRDLRKEKDCTIIFMGAGSVDKCAHLIFDKEYK